MASATVVAQIWKFQTFPGSPVKVGLERTAPAPANLEDVTLGGPNDLWGIDPAEITPEFVNTLLQPSVTMTADQGASAACEIDAYSVTVYFTLPDGRRGSISMPIGMTL